MKKLLLFFSALPLLTLGIAQSFEKFTRMYDPNYLLTEDPVSAKYIALFEYSENVCRKTEYYMKEKEIKSITYYSDTSCKVKITN
jgi:hypothetical protein